MYEIGNGIPTKPRQPGTIYMDSITENLYIYKIKPGQGQWQLMRDFIFVEQDPTIVPPIATLSDIIIYNKTPYMNFNNIWNAIGPDLSTITFTANQISDLNSVIANAIINKVDKITSIAGGTFGSSSKTLTATFNTQGQATAISEQNISVVSSQISDLNSTISSAITTGITSKVDKINITSGTAGNSSNIPVFNYNTQGQITSNTNTPISITSTQVTDLGTTISTAIISANKVDKINISSGTAGSATQIPVLTFNTQGQITGNTNTTLSATSSQITDFTTAVNSLASKKPLVAMYHSTNSPIITGTTSAITWDTKDVDLTPTPIFDGTIITMPVAGGLELSGFLRAKLTSAISLSANTNIEIWAYYRSSSAGTFTAAKLLGSYPLPLALTILTSTTFLLPIPIPAIDISSINGGSLPVGSQIRLQGIQTTGSTIVIDPTTGSNSLKIKVLPS